MEENEIKQLVEELRLSYRSRFSQFNDKQHLAGFELALGLMEVIATRMRREKIYEECK